jgi:carnitine O-acetyltransferase
VVLCQNQFYYFAALWSSTGHVAIDEADVFDILGAIQKNAKQLGQVQQSKTAFGVFTSLPRSKWAIARNDLCEDETNRSALQIIDSALFVLVLDDFIPEDIHVAAANVLHGSNQMKENDTLQVGTCLNRWYDKLQLIVCKDGTSGLVFEHSIIDGHTALRFTSDVYAETLISFAESIVDIVHGRGSVRHVIQCTVERAAGKLDGPRLDVLPKKLLFNLSDSLLERIYYAETALCDEIHASDTYVLEYRDYGKRLIVDNKLSPDAFVQMSILLAYYRLYGKVECMYEPAMTKMFFHGRTEAIRGCTPQAKILCETWGDRNATNADKLTALRNAVKEHSRLTKEASIGFGVDRHLFALKCIAQRMEIRMPRFFKSQGWNALNHTVLSTSNCGNPALRLFGFGPVTPDGFGIGYIIKDSGISYSVCSKHRQTRRYVRSLRSTLTDLKDLLDPTSFVEVGQQRPTLKQVKENMLRKNSSMISDFWGETKAMEELLVDGISHHSKPLPALVRRQSSSQYFATIKERTVDLVGASNFIIDVVLDDMVEEDGKPK